jgi:hypothetical protein
LAHVVPTCAFNKAINNIKKSIDNFFIIQYFKFLNIKFTNFNEKYPREYQYINEKTENLNKKIMNYSKFVI